MVNCSARACTASESAGQQSVVLNSDLFDPIVRALCSPPFESASVRLSIEATKKMYGRVLRDPYQM